MNRSRSIARSCDRAGGRRRHARRPRPVELAVDDHRAAGDAALAPAAGCRGRPSAAARKATTVSRRRSIGSAAWKQSRRRSARARSRSSSATISATCATGCTGSRRTSSAPRRPSGTSARRRRGRSSRRRRRSACTRSRRSPSSTPTRPGCCCRSSTRSCSGATPASACRSWARRSRSPAIFSAGTGEQLGEWVPQCYGTPDDPQVGAFCVSRARRRLGRVVAAHPRALRRGEGRVGAQRPEGVGHQRRHRQRPRRDRVGRPRAEARAARPAFVIPPGTPGLTMGTKVKKHGLRASHTADVFLDDVPHPRPLPARRQGEARRAPRPRPRGHGARRSRPRCRRSRPRARRSARRPIGIARAAYEYALEYAKDAHAVRQADHREPGDRVRAGRHGAGDRRRAAARLARRRGWAARAASSSTPRAR